MLDRIMVRGLIVRRGGRELFQVGSLEFRPGETRALLGANGSGKSTLLRLLAGLEEDFTGEVFYGELPPASYFRGRRHPAELLLLPQEPVMFDLTVEANVAFGLRHLGLPAREVRARAAEALARFGIANLQRRRANRLSSGETRLVALARVLAVQPKFLLLDEPFAGIDRDKLEVVERQLLAVGAEWGGAVFFSTHLEGVALRLTAQILEIRAGRLEPWAGVNFFRGEAACAGDQFFFHSGGHQFDIPPFDCPPRVIYIPPSDIILSRQALTSSARNRLEGTIAAMREKDGLVDVDVHSDVTLVARITTASLREQGFLIGDRVYAHFKSAAVRFPGLDETSK